MKNLFPSSPDRSAGLTNPVEMKFSLTAPAGLTNPVEMKFSLTRIDKSGGNEIFPDHGLTNPVEMKFSLTRIDKSGNACQMAGTKVRAFLPDVQSL